MLQDVARARRPGGVTHAAIAARLGVSRAAVTQALHRTRSSHLRPELRQQILDMAREMSYAPRNVTTHTIGVLLSWGQLLNASDTALLAYLEKAASRRGFRLTVIDSDGPPSVPLADIVNRKTLDGVILTHWHDGSYHAALDPDLPCLLLSEEENLGGAIDQIGFDLVRLLGTVFRYLTGLGHQRLCLVTGVPHGEYYERLQHAALQAAASLEIAAADLHFVQTHPSHCAAPVMALMQRADRPTAIICADNYHLFPVYCSLLAAGYRIPDDVSILALVDDALYITLSPAVTATDALGADIAERVMDRLLARIEDPTLATARHLITGNMVPRASTGPLKNRTTINHRRE